jgi:hypothetical protein
MTIDPGLAPGATNSDVAELQSALTAIGLHIDPAETEAGHFGPSTVAAIASLQTNSGLPATGGLDDATIAVIGAAVAAERGARWAPDEAPPDDDDRESRSPRLTVRGRITWAEGSPVVEVAVRAFDQGLRSDQPLGPYAPGFEDETRTDARGSYLIPYNCGQLTRADAEAADLVVRVLGADGSVVATSPTLFNAPTEATINLTVGGAVAGQPSEYQRLVARVEPLLHDGDPPNLSGLQATDLDFLVGETGWSSTYISDLLSAVSLHQDAIAARAATDSQADEPPSSGVPVSAFYGLLRQGLPSAWLALLQQGEAAISAAVTSAAKGGVIPLHVEARADEIAAQLAAIAAHQVLASNGAGQASTVAKILGAAGLSAAQQQTVVAAASTATGSPEQFWADLSARPGFGAAVVARLQLTLQLGLLTGNHVPLMQQLLKDATLTSPKDLVSMDSTAWTALLDSVVDGQPIGVPPGTPGATPAEQAANYVQLLTSTLHAAFPTATVAHVAATNPDLVAEPDIRTGVSKFFANAPDFDVRTSRISKYLTGHGDTALAGIPTERHAAVIRELKRLQRAFQVSVSADSMAALLSAGLDAAHLVADIPPRSFVDRYAVALGGENVARAVHQRAGFINARSAELIAQLNDSVNGVWPAALVDGAVGNHAEALTAQVLESYPDYAELFGALDPCDCEDCTSVLSPAAYFVDMLQFLKGSTPNAADNTPLDVLIGGGTPALWVAKASQTDGTTLTSLTVTAGAPPRIGDAIAGGGVRQPCTIMTVTGSGPYAVSTSQPLPPGTDITFVGGPAGAWVGSTPQTDGSNQVSLTVESGPAPQVGDVILGGALDKTCTVTKVNAIAGGYTLTVSQAIPAGTNLTFVGKTPPPGRRPDLAYLKLTCENTDTELPYIDLVNEVLESYILYNGPSPQAAHDTGQATTAELDANPQYTLDGFSGPYFTLASAVYPFTLPYNQPIVAAKIYLKSLGTSRFEILNTFLGTPGSVTPAVDAESLGLDPYLYELLTGWTLDGNQVANRLQVPELYGYAASTPGWESTVASVPTLLARAGIAIEDLIALLRTSFVNPRYPTGPDRAFFAAIPLDYAALMTLVQQNFTTTDPNVLGSLTEAGMSLSGLSAWWSRHPDIGQALVIYSADGVCDIADGRLAHLSDQSAPTDPELDVLQAFIRLWRAVGWRIADLDRAFAALGQSTITTSFIHDLAAIKQIQATLKIDAVQAVLALWADLDPDGDDSLYRQLFLNSAALPIDQAFALGADGAVLQDSCQTITSHLPALVAALQVSADDLDLIIADTGVTSSTPQIGDVIAGGGIPEPCTITNVTSAGSGSYAVTTSRTIPAGTNVTFGGGSTSVWVGTASPAGDSDEMTLTVAAGPAPQVGDQIAGGGLPQPCILTAVSKSGPSTYTVTGSQTIPAGTGVTFSGGTTSLWVGTASPAGGTNSMTLTLTASSAALTLRNVSSLYRYATLARALNMSVSDFITLRSLAGTAYDAFTSPDATVAFVALARDVQRSGFTVAQLAYLYRNDSVPPTGLAPQQATLALLAQALCAGLSQIAAQCAIAPDPKGALTASTLTQLISKTVATETVALVNGTATYRAPLSTTLPAALAAVNGSGATTGINPTKTPTDVGAKLSYDPANGTLAYAGAMTTQERNDLLAVSNDPAYQLAVSSLYDQPGTFFAGNLGALLATPTAADAVLRAVASLDGQLNPVLLDAHGTVVTEPARSASTASAWKFNYLLETLLPYLQNQLSRTLVKQTISDTFGIAPSLASVLLEQLLVLPSSGEPLIDDLLALSDAGVTAEYYLGALSGAPSQTATVAAVNFDGTTAAASLPPGTHSAAFTSWLQVPSSATFTFQVQTGGTPRLFIGDPTVPLALISRAGGMSTASVTLSAGQLTYVRLEVSNLGATPTAVLTWQAPTTPSGPLPAASQLPDAAYQAFALAYVRVQKAALLASQFALTPPELNYLAAAGKNGLFAGFDLNALPVTSGATPTGVATWFSSWVRVVAYTALRNSLPRGPVTLVDVFSATSFGAAAALVPQATGWPSAAVTELLGALFPSATSASPNPFLDEVWLARLQACVKLVQLVGASPTQLFEWATYSWPSSANASAAQATFAGLDTVAGDIKKAAASHHDAQTWLTVAEPVSDSLRADQRDALVAYLLGINGWTDPDRLFELLLIDPEMGSCMRTSRIRQALNSVQLFVQRCLFNLEADPADPALTVEPAQIDAATWREWMGAYSQWAANREVFLYPENWLLPALRDDQTPLFETFASSLQQVTISGDTVTTGFLTYLRGLEQIDRLDVRAVLWQGPDPDYLGAPGTLHVFARTFHKPYQYFYRRQIIGSDTEWTPWEKVDADIQSDHLVAALWDGRLRLIWPTFTQQSYIPKQGNFDKNNPKYGDQPKPYWQITLAWSEYYQGTWQTKQVTDDFLLSAAITYSPGDTFLVQVDQSRHLFKARLEGDDLVVDCYVLAEGAVHAYRLGEFRFSACGDSVTVAYDSWYSPPAAFPVPPHLGPDVPSNYYQYLPPWTQIYNNGIQQDTSAIQLASASPQLELAIGVPDAPLSPTQSPQVATWPYLQITPTRFELCCSQQYWQFAEQAPFIYQDTDRTFCVTPFVIAHLFNPLNIHPVGLVASITHDAPQRRLPVPPTNAAALDRGSGVAAEPVAVAAPVDAIGQAVTPANPASAAVEFSAIPEVPSTRNLASGGGNWESGSQGVYGPPVGLAFETHYHPYVCNLIESLVNGQGQDQTGGIDALLNLKNQNLSSGFNFVTVYGSDANLVFGDPSETIDFTPTGAYSVYNWELFFHAPLLVALTLSRNQQFEQADRWFRYIFDPTHPPDATTSAPECYWQVQPFRKGVPQTLLDLMAALDTGDPNAVQQFNVWYQHPFEPFRIARLRIGAFMKYVFMAYLDNLIAWGDQLFGQVDTVESINQATQLYLMASELLGQLPGQLPSPHTPTELSYLQIQSRLDRFSNLVELVENEFPFAGGVTSNPQGQSPGLLGMSKLLFFCIPQNQQLLGYWSTVNDRLYKIRNCLNIQGVPQQLALFQPPANPLLLIQAPAQRVDSGSVLADVNAPLPNYRFSYLIGKAAELASVCQTFGHQLLETLEKNDAEGLALLRATQESAILTMMQDQKQQQVNEANQNVDALTGSRNVALTRYGFYETLLGNAAATPAVGDSITLETIPTEPPQSSGGVELIAEEMSELSLSNQAALLHVGAGVLQTLASIFAYIPTFTFQVSVEPIGVGGRTGVSYGGSNLASATEAFVHGIETVANYLTYQAWSAGKMGGYFRRQQEWALQSNLAAGEIMQIDKQIKVAHTRVTIATDELSVHNAQIDNARKVEDFLTSKFTNQQLYGWMITQASGLYSQLYQLAYGAAKRAEIAFQRELGVQDSHYITFGYWDSLRKGLLAGDRLQLAVRQLEQAYLDQNQREFEITRHVSLLLHDPGALMALKTTGECVVDLPEQLFDMDYPGQYHRMLRDVSLTIPCVTGPYVNINCTLTLVSSKIRIDPTITGSGDGYTESKAGADPRFIYNYGSTAAIATSRAQDDNGVFTVNFRDERYLPFETAGVISRWMITMPPECNAFDFDTITDVVLKLSYTARYGGDALRGRAFSAATLPALPRQTPAAGLGSAAAQTDRDRLFSLKHEFPTEWYGLLHPTDAAAAFGQMPLWLTSIRFPFQYRGRTISTRDIEVFALLRNGSTLGSLDVYLTPTGKAPLPGHPPPSAPTQSQLGNPVALNTQSVYGATALYGVMPETSPIDVSQAWWLSIAAGDLNNVINEIEDLFVLFHYSVS